MLVFLAELLTPASTLMHQPFTTQANAAALELLQNPMHQASGTTDLSTNGLLDAVQQSQNGTAAGMVHFAPLLQTLYHPVSVQVTRAATQNPCDI